jgi:hypothetical protein
MSVMACLQNMWDLTPPTELLQELPAEYSTESALADLVVSFFLFEYLDSSFSFMQSCKVYVEVFINFSCDQDNSLQAIWSNGKKERKLIRLFPSLL